MKNALFFPIMSLLVLGLLSISQMTLAQGTSLKSMVNRTTIAMDETLELKVRYTGPNQRQKPSFDLLKTHFEIISDFTDTRFQAINGNVTSYTDWTFVLSPKKEGRLIVPSFRLGSLISDAVEINVTPASQNTSTNVKDIFIETLVDKTDVYVQEQVILTYKLYFSLNLNTLDNPIPEIDNVLMEALPDSRYNRRINGKAYGVAEFKYALFPESSGTIVIPPMKWTVTFPKGNQRSFLSFSGRVETRRLRTEEVTLEVKPKPPGFPSISPWLAASKLTLEESWSGDPEKLSQGEPITRTLTLRAEGLMASQLPQIWEGIDHDSIKTYSDKADIKEEFVTEGAHSIRVESTAVVLGENGEATLPAIKLPWWDTTSDSLQYAAIPERKLKTIGAPTKSEQSGTPSPTETYAPDRLNQSFELGAAQKRVRFWQTISLILAIALIVSLILSVWLVLRKPVTHSTQKKDTKTPGDRKRGLNAIIKKCTTGNPKEIRSALLEWAEGTWPNSRIFTLDELAHHVNNNDFARQLHKLDQALYGNVTAANIDGAAIAEHIHSYVSARENETESPLAPLYPT